MGKDKLEQFVRLNVERFNDLEPPAMVWKTIENGLQANKTSVVRKIWPYAWKAVAAILIFASAWLLKDYKDHKRSLVPAINASEISTNPQLGELPDAEAYYTTQIGSKQAELAMYARQNPEIMEDLKLEFKEMDKNKDELQKDLAESNADEKVIEAIILSYRVKLEILNQMLAEFRKAKDGSKKPVPTNL